MRTIPHKIPWPLTTKISLEIIYLQFHCSVAEAIGWVEQQAVPWLRGVYSVRFRIGMLSTACRLEMLQGSKRGVETIHFAQFWWKIWVEIKKFPHFCWNIGVETIQIFQRPEKGGSKWRSICSNLHIVSTPTPHPPHPQPPTPNPNNIPSQSDKWNEMLGF